MNSPIIFKEHISINIIGQRRFWGGVAVGILMAVLLSFGFNYSRESFRIFTSLSADLIMPSQEEFQFFNYFYSALSSTLGLSLAIWIWMGNPYINRSREKLLKRLAQTNAIFNFWMPLLVIGRFASVLPFILFGLEGYDNHLDFREEFGVIFFLIPIFTFMQSWVVVQLVYKSFRWVWISLVTCIFLTLTFSFTTKIDQNVFNKIYLNQFEEEYEYIDSTLNFVENHYNFIYSTKTIDVLKKWHTDGSMNQIQEIKKAFTKKRQISLDTIILARIIIHNLKEGYWVRRKSNDAWHYPVPQDVYHQIKKHNPSDPEVVELFKLLSEQIELANKPDLDWEQRKTLSRIEQRRVWFSNYKFPFPIRLQLIEIHAQLEDDPLYKNYHYLLHPVNRKD